MTKRAEVLLVTTSDRLPMQSSSKQLQKMEEPHTADSHMYCGLSVMLISDAQMLDTG